MRETTDPDRTLSDALRAVASDDDYGASPAIEARLRAEVRALAATQRASVTQVFAIAASLLLIVGAMTWMTSRVSPTRNVDVTPMTTEFLPLIHSQLSLAGTYIVRMELPRRALASFGLAPAEDFAAPGTVLADVAVGEDGLARAVRFIQPAR